MGEKSHVRVLTEPVTYDSVYIRLKKYLCFLGLHEGETPHSLRGGCAITIMLTGAADNTENSSAMWAGAHKNQPNTTPDRLP